MCAATSPDGIRGMSINCVSGDSNITVRDKETGEIKTINIENLYTELGITNPILNVKSNNNVLYIEPHIEIDFSDEDIHEL
jgi:hypothetical protein